MTAPQTQLAQLTDFSVGRAGWVLKKNGPGGAPYAQRRFEFPEVNGGEHVYLFMVAVADSRREPFEGQVRLPFSAGPESSFSGSAEEVIEGLAGWEKILSLPGQLRDCSDRQEAYDLVQRAKRADLRRLIGVLNLPERGLQRPQDRLVNTFCPAVRKAGKS